MKLAVGWFGWLFVYVVFWEHAQPIHHHEGFLVQGIFLHADSSFFASFLAGCCLLCAFVLGQLLFVIGLLMVLVVVLGLLLSLSLSLLLPNFRVVANP